MSTLTQQPPPLTTTVERRFYPRVAPQTPLFVAIKENEPQGSLLLNVSENGLLVSTPIALKCNHVTRISIPLNGLPKPVDVTIRVAWVSEAINAAGVQLLDLSEHDRQQIRKWGARESAQSSQPESEYLPEPVPFFPISSATPQPAPTFGRDDAPSSIRSSLATRALSVNARTRLAPFIPSPTMRVALVAAAVGLAATVLLIKAGTINPFASSRESRDEIASASPSNTIPPAPEIQDTSQIAPVVPSAPTASPAKENSSPAPVSVDQSFQQIEGGTTHPSPADRASLTPHATPKNHPADSLTASRPLLTPTETASLSSPATENALTSRTTQGATAVGPTPTDNAPKIGATSVVTPPAPLSTAPAQPTPSQPLLSPTQLTDVPAAHSSSSTIPPPGPIASPANPTGPIKSAPAVRQAIQPSLQPVVHMDAPRSQTLEVHLPSGYQKPFFSLPGERVLETPTVTMHIQRSVHMPPARSWPFNHNKKVVVGELISRVDPPPAQVTANAATSATSVRVKATVSKDGRIENVTQILGPPSLVPAVAKALHEWRYQPTLVDNKPVETQCFVIFQFHAQSYHAAKR